MQKKAWLISGSISTIILCSCITVWGTITQQSIVVTIGAALLTLSALVIGLFQIDAVGKTFKTLWSSLFLPSTASPLSRRESLAALALMAFSALGGVGLIAYGLLSQGGSKKALYPLQSSSGIFYTFDDNTQVDGWLISDQETTGSKRSWDPFGHEAKGSLMIDTPLWGSLNPNRPQPKQSADAYTHAEILLYFKHPLSMQDFSGYNFSGKTATCWVFFPEAVDPEGVYVSIVVKSYDPHRDSYFDQEGSIVFLSSNRGMWFPLSLTIGNFERGAYHDKDFDPTRVAVLGVLIHADPMSTFKGKNIQWYMDDCTIS